MKKCFFASLLLAVLFPASLMADLDKELVNGSNNTIDSGQKPWKKMMDNPWLKYEDDSLPSDYLFNLGFSTRGGCAISLMRSMSFNSRSMEGMRENIRITGERGKVFGRVVQEGLKILRDNKNFKKLSDENAKKAVYQALTRSEVMLTVTIMAMRENAKSEKKKEAEMATAKFNNAKHYKTIYKKTGCEDILEYKLEAKD